MPIRAVLEEAVIFLELQSHQSMDLIFATLKDRGFSREAIMAAYIMWIDRNFAADHAMA